MKTKLIFSMFMSLLVAVLVGVPVAAAIEVSPVLIVAGLFAVSFIPLPSGVAMDTVYRSVWTGEIIKTIDSGLKDTFLDGIPDKSQYVTGDDESQTINSTFFGVEPEVLINNTTYPIPIVELNGENVPIVLDKYQTTATPITDDELYALAYDKIKAVKDSHANAIVRNRLAKAAHALAPAGHTANTPVIVTTGAVTPDGSRKRLKWEDIITLREAYSEAGIDVDGMRLVLCPAHVNDLILTDLDLFKSLANVKAGVVDSQLGFEIRSFSKMPYYDVAAKTKLAFGALATADHRMASVVFLPSLARKAMGLTKMYFSEAKNDTQFQRNLINFRNYFVALPSVNKAIGAIVSAIPA